MAQRRMFSPDIVESEEFITMPISSQALYFHLCMNADDDGFVQPTKIMRMINSSPDDIKVLLVKRFLLNFETGVVVIKHWLIHNLIRADRYKETRYIEEKNTLIIKENKGYSDGLHSGNQMATQVRLGKDRVGEVSIEDETSSSDIPLLIKSFEIINPACKKFYGNTTQRKACQDLIDTYTFEVVQRIVENTLPRTNGMQFFPTITTPVQLRDKWASLESAVKKYQAEKQTTINKNKVAF